jgi:hypothetical protein
MSVVPAFVVRAQDVVHSIVATHLLGSDVIISGWVGFWKWGFEGRQFDLMSRI